jgi:hypothetical protein
VINLVCREFKDRHFSDKIKEYFVAVMSQFKIFDHQLLAISVDSASNITLAADKLIESLNKNSLMLLLDEEPDLNDVYDLNDEDFLEEMDVLDESIDDMAIRISCVVHKLQLAVNKFMWKDDAVAKLIAKATKLSTKLRTSIVRLKMDIEGVKTAIMHQVTRWNSTYLMLVRLLELKDFCVKFQDHKDYTELKIASRDWEKITKLVEVLRSVANLTSTLQAEDLTVPDFVYHWYAMKMKLQGMEDSSYSKKLLKCIEEREKFIFQNKIVLAGWYLDKNLNVLMEPQ